jgi:hypothetical protein
MATRIPSNAKRFRPAILPSAAFLLLVALSGLFCIVLILDGLKFDRHALLIAVIFVTICSLAGALFLSFFSTAGFSSDGVYGHSFWGVRRFASWRDIEDARPFRLLNLPWLRVYTVDKRVTWLALFQSREPEFRQEIQRLAPVSSPILNHLR